MDLHDAPEQRMQLATAAQLHALDVVDGILAAEDEDEEQLRIGAAEMDHATRRQALPPYQAGDVEAGPVDELLEHQRVLRLLDDLVVGVAELGGAVRQTEGELEQASLERALELQTDLHERGHHVEADAGAHPGWLAPVPLGSTEHVVGRQLPARVVVVDVKLRAVPGNVGV